MQKWIIGFVIFGIIVLGGYIVSNISIETDYTPEVEIDEGNLRKTTISLYFYNEETKKLEKETRLIDSKELLKEPYKKVLELLISGPEKEGLKNIIPENSKITSINLEGDVLKVGFSKDFLSAFQDEEKKDNIVEAISKTLSEFKEINSVNVIIEEANDNM